MKRIGIDTIIGDELAVERTYCGGAVEVFTRPDPCSPWTSLRLVRPVKHLRDAVEAVRRIIEHRNKHGRPTDGDDDDDFRD